MLHITQNPSYPSSIPTPYLYAPKQASLFHSRIKDMEKGKCLDPGELLGVASAMV